MFRAVNQAFVIHHFLFLGGRSPETPFPACGVNLTIDGLDCKKYAGCP